MITGPLLLVVFAAAVALLLILILRFEIDPFLALLVSALLTAVAVGMPLGKIGEEITRGFGGTLGSIGIVIGLGIILGSILLDAGATDEIAARLLGASGPRRAPLATNLTGYLLSIPVFIDAAFVITAPLIGRVARRTGIPWIAYVTALSVGLMATHAMVVPTPGPLAVAANMELDVGLFMLYGLAVSLPASLVGGWVYGLFLARGSGATAMEPAPVETPGPERSRPSAALALTSLLLPVLLILIGSFARLLLPAGSATAQLASLVGDKNVALLLGVIFAIAALRRHMVRPLSTVIGEAAASSGLILLITGAGGAFGAVISTSGIGAYLVETMTSWSVSLLLLGFLLSAILRASQGSATVAMITTSAILGSGAGAGGASPLLVGLAICAGAMCASLPNDSAFWVVSRFGGLSTRDTLKSWTVGGTVAGVVALVVILLLSLFPAGLPGV